MAPFQGDGLYDSVSGHQGVSCFGDTIFRYIVRLYHLACACVCIIWFVSFSFLFRVRFSDPPAATSSPKRPRQRSPSPVQVEPCDSTQPEAVSAPVQPVQHSEPNRADTEYWFKQFHTRLEKFVDLLLIYSLPVIQRTMCRNHCALILWRLHNCVEFVHVSIGTLCRLTETTWWTHDNPFKKAVPNPERPIECRPWHTAYQHQTVRATCRLRLFHLVQIARDLQDQMRSCLCCARHARRFCVDLIKQTDRLRVELCESIKADCTLHT